MSGCWRPSGPSGLRPPGRRSCNHYVAKSLPLCACRWSSGCWPRFVRNGPPKPGRPTWPPRKPSFSSTRPSHPMELGAGRWDWALDWFGVHGRPCGTVKNWRATNACDRGWLWPQVCVGCADLDTWEANRLCAAGGRPGGALDTVSPHTPGGAMHPYHEDGGTGGLVGAPPCTAYRWAVPRGFGGNQGTLAVKFRCHMACIHALLLLQGVYLFLSAFLAFLPQSGPFPRCCASSPASTRSTRRPAVRRWRPLGRR